MGSVNLEQFENLLYETLCIAIGAGKIIMRFHGDTTHVEKKDKSPLTQADLESNAYIIRQLQKISPYKVCSEEAVLAYHERKDLEYLWLVDPLDGTKDFLSGNGNFTINIALLHKNEVILGVVYAPCLYEAYIGLQNFGSFSYNVCDFREFTCVENSKMAQIEWLKTHKILLAKEYAKKIYGDRLEFLFGVDSYVREEILKNLERHIELESISTQKQLIACDSIHHSTKETEEFLQKYNALVLKRGSSLKICALASGIADIYPRMNGTSEWDTAAGEIILSESGGITLDLQTKKPLRYNKENIRNNHFVGFAKSCKNSSIYKDLMQS
ncbi:3'(2'),5'-bisphosphate nucleotidase CysQ [Helicobacter trogontum]|uniref:3'(2'),5'-bisphosphate nucleotidase CysQ n=1 Tax=Helicobacter trogontum TaxID=50960 RepID=A0ABQ0D6W9_9HELI